MSNQHTALYHASQCHPDRKHEANGLCKPCYNSAYNAARRTERAAHDAAYYAANRDKVSARYSARPPEWRSWRNAKKRVSDRNDRFYHRYGGRGITMAQAWMDSFQAFQRDMGPRPDGMTLDRIDPDGNYEPGNCRWADAKTQRANQSLSEGTDR